MWCECSKLKDRYFLFLIIANRDDCLSQFGNSEPTTIPIPAMSSYDKRSAANRMSLEPSFAS